MQFELSASCDACDSNSKNIGLVDLAAYKCLINIDISCGYYTTTCNLDPITSLACLYSDSQLCGRHVDDLVPCYECDTVKVVCNDQDTDLKEIANSFGYCQVSNTYIYNLILVNKNFSSIRNNSFSNVTSISLLDLTNNQIQRIDVEAFDSMLNLRVLDLKRNRLTSLDFGNVPKYIEILTVKSNRLTAIYQNTFLNLIKLKILDLSSNKIELINQNAFNANTDLRKLEFKSNNIKIVEFIIAGLVCLSLDRNKIEILKNQSFQGFNLLRGLNLNSNRIKRIEKNAFSDLSSSIYRIELKGNYLESINSEAFGINFSALKYLHLSEIDIGFL